MNRAELVKQAKEAGQAAGHNLQLIAREPERMNSPEKLVDGITYLNTMIRFAEEEKKNVRLAGRTLSLRTRLKSLVVSILADDNRKRKEGTA
ncbi:hypothetical protein J41TS12_11120 [Paenibacillus antibioticophila]|uniref:Uncharacterized protein n=1 Tax=Paenibacillus antibioticophila TaxID=1274374 RepID=A0A920CDU8_9BACL|nr:hypothetical protein [Paenibacillus antibioticophila]GIO36251.1 hypothetical protein J41TS12_11120 [Paenibacillus antibioticophila]